MTRKYITISLSQAKILRGALNTAGKWLNENADRKKNRLPCYGWAYDEGKAADLLKLGKLIDKKIKEL